MTTGTSVGARSRSFDGLSWLESRVTTMSRAPPGRVSRFSRSKASQKAPHVEQPLERKAIRVLVPLPATASLSGSPLTLVPAMSWAGPASRSASASGLMEGGHEQGRGNPLARDVAHQHRRLVLAEGEVVEEIAAHLSGGDGDPTHLGKGEAQVLPRQQLLLDPPADLQLLAEALLLDQPLLVGPEVAGHAVEGLGQTAELGAVGDGHPHVEVAAGQEIGRAHV